MGNINSINYLRPDFGNLPLLPLPFYAYCTGIHTATPSYTQYNEEINHFVGKRPASSMVMVDRGEIFSKGEMATK